MNIDGEEEFDDSGNAFTESGPFCRHWSELGMCDEKCKACGHDCGQHPSWNAGDELACNVDGCGCLVWRDEENKP